MALLARSGPRRRRARWPAARAALATCAAAGRVVWGTAGARAAAGAAAPAVRVTATEATFADAGGRVVLERTPASLRVENRSGAAPLKGTLKRPVG